MVNPMKGQATLGTHTLTFNFAAFCMLEEKTGKKMPLLLQSLQEGMGFGELRDFAWAGLQANHQMAEADVAALLDEVGFEAAASAIGKAVTSFFGEQREKGKNPPKAK